MKSWRLKNRCEKLILHTITIFTIKAIDVNTITAINNNLLHFPLNQTCSATSVLINATDIFKYEEIMIGMDLNEIERENTDVEMKDAPAVCNRTIVFFLPFNLARTRSVFSNVNDTFKFVEITINIDCNEKESEITVAEIKHKRRSHC